MSVEGVIQSVGDTSTTEPATSAFNNFGSGDQFNNSGGTQNINRGNGNLFNQSHFSGPVHFISQIDEGRRNSNRQCDPSDLPLDNYSQFENRCLADLWVTDPLLDKTRIVNGKGGLLQESFRWILQTQEFLQWRDGDGGRLLWIKGDPSKGKTMLLCGLIDELRPMTRLAVENASQADILLALFFCQANDNRTNTGTAVLRSLIWLLVRQQPSLVCHVQARYDARPGKQVFEGPNAWVGLTEIFFAILDDPALSAAFVIVDALDECISGRDLLLQLIADALSRSDRVKWIISSRNWPEIDKRLRTATQGVPLSLELNAESVSNAVGIFIQHRVGKLAHDNEYDETTRSAIYDYLIENACGTFLWVAPVCQNLATVPSLSVREALYDFPPDLEGLYRRMMEKIKTGMHRRSTHICEKVLGLVCTVLRPLSVDELCALLPEVPLNGTRAMREIVQLCGSFLTLNEDSGVGTVQFIHKSAKDYLVTHETTALFPSGRPQETHQAIFHRSLEVLRGQLRRDIYSLRHPGRVLSEITPPNPDPLATIRYACVYWADHAQAACGGSPLAPADVDKIYSFLQAFFLYWLEALSLMQKIPHGIVAIGKLLECLANEKPESDLSRFINDTLRFLLYHRPVIEEAPLQVYSSALLFSPYRSLVRGQFNRREKPDWALSGPQVDAEWTPCLQTLTGHENCVSAVSWSPDGRYIVSALYDQTLKIWDATKGLVIQTLTGHENWVTAVAWSPNSRYLISGSYDRILKIWDVTKWSAT